MGRGKKARFCPQGPGGGENMNKNSIIYTIIFGFITTFIFVVPLSIAYNVTKPLVAFNSEIAKKRAVLASFDLLDANTLLTNEQIAQLYSKVQEKEFNNRLVFVYQDGEEQFYAGQFTVAGLWGPITAVVSFPSDLSRVKSFSVVSHSETPGLGARITEPWFVEQVKNEAFNNGSIAVNSLPKDKNDKDDGQIDAITGATRTSDAMAALFRTARTEMENIIRRIQ